MKVKNSINKYKIFSVSLGRNGGEVVDNSKLVSGSVLFEGVLYFNDRRDFRAGVSELFNEGPCSSAEVATGNTEVNFAYKTWHWAKFVVCLRLLQHICSKKGNDLK